MRVTIGMDGITELLEFITSVWERSACAEAVYAAKLLSDALKTPPVLTGWEDPDGIKCTPPDIASNGLTDDPADQIVKIIK